MGIYPLSHNCGKKLDEFFYRILTFHVPFSDNVVILDPTCGKRYLWRKLIVKCSDQYHTELRKFIPTHIIWVNELSNFELIDVFIFLYHHVSPTSFQVKERPCSVITHTYFLVFRKKLGIG